MSDAAEIAQHWNLTLTHLDGDRDALAFLQALNDVVNTWDDLIDRDTEIGPAEIHRAFTALLVDIPRNPFYRRWQNELQPCIETAIADWHAANRLERGGDEQKARAHVLRFNLLSVWVLCARIKRGMEGAIEAATALRNAIPTETLADYLREHAHGHQE